MSAPGPGHLDTDLDVHSSVTLNTQQSLDFDEFGTEYLVDHVVADGNVAFNMEARDASGALLVEPGSLTNYESNINIGGGYYVDDGLMGDQNEYVNDNNRFILNTEVGNISVTREDLISVGVDVSDPSNINVSIEQSDTLLQMCQDRGDIIEPDYDNFGLMQSEIVEYPKDNIERHQYYRNDVPGPSTSAIHESHKPQEEVYPFFGENGDLSLVGRNGRCVVTYNREILLSMGINDVTSLTDGDMATLIRNINTRRNLEQSNLQELDSYSQNDIPPSLFLHKPITHSMSPRHPEFGDGIIGESVDIIQDDGEPKSAVIRYSRQNGTYKVQFEDGHFEWVKEDEIIHRKSKQKLSDVPKKVKKKIPIDFRTNHLNGPVERPNLMHSTNGYCALCDKRIANARPAFIVLRIPACKCCAESKALLLEDVLHGYKEPKQKRKHEDGVTNLSDFKAPPSKRFKPPAKIVRDNSEPPPQLERVN